MKSVLAVVLLVVVGSAALSQTPPAANESGNPPKPPSARTAEPGVTQRWEYKAIPLTEELRTTADVLEHQLNHTAIFGYEIDRVIGDVLIFKRPFTPANEQQPVRKPKVFNPL